MEEALEKRLDELEETPPMVFSFPIEAGKIREFADAIYSDHEIFRDADAAATEGYSSIPAPLTFVETYRFERSRHEAYEPDEFFDEQLALHGAQEYEIHRQPEVGDRLTARRSLQKTFTKKGSNGQLIFGIFKTDYEDADGAPVVTTKKTRIITE